MPPGRLWRWPLLLPLAVFSVSLAAALRAALPGTDGHLIYALDDAYIHMAMAKNVAHEGVWGCTPFHFSSSSSSLLWTLVVAVAYGAFCAIDVVPLVLNVVFAVAALWVADRYLARFGAARLLRAAAALGLVIAFPMAGMVLMGMEHILHLLLTIGFAGAVLEALTSQPEDRWARRRQTVALCALGALLAASRYEGVFLVGLACLGFLVRRQPLRGVAIGASAALPITVFGVLSVARGAFFLPNSVTLKGGGESGSALSALLKPFGRDDLVLLQNDRALAILLGCGLLGALWQWAVRRDLWQPQVVSPLLLALMILLHDHFVFSPTFWVYRYDAYLVGLGIFVAAVVVSRLREPAFLPPGLGAALGVAALVALVADVREGLVPATEIDGMRNTYLEHYQTAQFVRRYYAGDVVLVNDLGAVTYFTEARILDLVGLGDVEPLEIMRRTGGSYTSADVVAWTQPYHPSIAIVQLGWAWVAPRVPSEWIKVAELEVPPGRHRVGFFAVDPRQAWTLRASVEQHYGPLRQALGYRLKLQRPEKLDRLAAGTGNESAERAASGTGAPP